MRTKEPAEPARKAKSAWLTRWLHSHKAGAEGDVIAAEIGEGARGIAVGKNIVQIGAIVIPLLPLLLVVLALGGGAGYSAWLYFVPTEMSGLFNIAVAEFGEVDAQDTISSSENGRRLSQWVFESLEDALGDLPGEFAVSVWHDSLNFTRKRVKIGIVPGSTAEERAEAAAALAAQLNADMLIYGNLVFHEDESSFVPEYYVSDLRNHAEEITGRHQLGTAIPLFIPFDVRNPISALPLNRELSARTKVLIQFTLGLLYELTGDPETALERFEHAEVQFEDWGNESGKEVLYIFIGRSLLFMHEYERALEAFEQAVAINPAYTRGYLGLGSAYYELAQLLTPEERLEKPEIEQAIGYYRRALETAPQSPGADLELKSHLALGTAYRLRAEAYYTIGQVDAALDDYDVAIQHLRQGISLAGDQVDQHLAFASLALAVAYEQKAYLMFARGEKVQARELLSGALDIYSDCIRYAEKVPHQWYRELKAGYCVPYQAAVEETLKTGWASGD